MFFSEGITITFVPVLVVHGRYLILLSFDTGNAIDIVALRPITKFFAYDWANLGEPLYRGGGGIELSS